MIPIRASTTLPFLLFITSILFLIHIFHTRPLPSSQIHNLAHDTEESIADLLISHPYHGRTYFSTSADIYDRARLSEMLQSHQSHIHAQVQQAETDMLEEWRKERERERQLVMARLGKDQGEFISFDPLKENPAKNPDLFRKKKPSKARIADGSAVKTKVNVQQQDSSSDGWELV